MRFRRNPKIQTARKGKPFRAAVFCSLMLTIATPIWWMYFTAPSEIEKPLFRGVTYQRKVLHSPRLATVHLLVIQTRTPGLHFFVTPPDAPGAELPLRGRTVGEFVQEHHLQAGVNADFFNPWKSNGPWDYYPHKRDPVAVEGDAITEGKRYAVRDHRFQETLYLTRDNQPSLTSPKHGEIFNAVGGHSLLKDGVFPLRDNYALHQPDPRTAVGWAPDRSKIYIVVVDGRQPGYSVGLTLQELAEYFKTLGVRDAIQLDGGGSSAMVVEEKNGKTHLLSRPIDQHIPGKQRYVANHLGIYAAPL